MSIYKLSKKKPSTQNTSKQKLPSKTKSTKTNKFKTFKYKVSKTKSQSKTVKIESIKLKNYISLNTHNNKKNESENKKITYKSVFMNNKKINKDIVFLNQSTFDIFYSYKYKYPLLVREKLTILTGTGEKKIIRADIPDPWHNDPQIPLKYSFTFNDYDTYEYYGGSYGHNAPAGWHKHNMDDYIQTFNLSNITPQNYSLNGGLWNLLEYFCKSLQYNKKISNINIFTGSIPNTVNSLFYNAKLEESIINIPNYMFKIVYFTHLEYPNFTFIEIFLFANKFYDYKNYFSKPSYNINFIKYILPIKSYNWFENITGINIINLLKFYNIRYNNIKSFKNIINLNLQINEKNKLILYIGSCYLKSKLFESSTTLDKLYFNYNIIYETNKTPLDILILNNLFYKARNKLIRDKILYTNITNLTKFNDFFIKLENELNTKYIINKDLEIEILGTSQDEYLHKYYKKAISKYK